MNISYYTRKTNIPFIYDCANDMLCDLFTTKSAIIVFYISLIIIYDWLTPYPGVIFNDLQCSSAINRDIESLFVNIS